MIDVPDLRLEFVEGLWRDAPLAPVIRDAEPKELTLLRSRHALFASLTFSRSVLVRNRLTEAITDEERSIVHQALTDHYRNTLDEPIPALGNQTPRKAVKTAKGRKKVIAWLKMLENQSAQQQRPEDPMGAYDFTWLWRELGVGDERR